MLRGIRASVHVRLRVRTGARHLRRRGLCPGCV